MNHNILQLIANKVSNKLYLVFDSFGDEADTHYELLSIHMTLDEAYQSAKKLGIYTTTDPRYLPINSKTDANGIFIGNRDDMHNRSLGYCWHGGIIIEEYIIKN